MCWAYSRLFLVRAAISKSASLLFSSCLSYTACWFCSYGELAKRPPRAGRAEGAGIPSPRAAVESPHTVCW